MSHHLTEEYWESLGPTAHFLWKISKPVSATCPAPDGHDMLEDHTMEAQTNVSDATAKAMLAI